MPPRDKDATLDLFPIGSIVTTSISKITKYGIYLDLGEGLTGIVRTRELSWDTEITDATEFRLDGKEINEGQPIKAMVLRTDTSQKKIYLSIRHVAYDPWEKNSRKYTPGSIVRGTILFIGPQNAIVELGDHITARLCKEDIVPWNLSRIESILEKGDQIEGVVTGRDDALREVVISMKERLEALAKEVANPDDTQLWIDAAASNMPETVSSEPSLHPANPPRKISTILIIDDEEDQYLGLEALLEELDHFSVTSCGDFREGVQTAITRNFDLIMLDVRARSGDFDGVLAAEKILAVKPDALVVLVTGDESAFEDERIKQLSLSLAGLLLKPVTFELLADAIGRIERIGHAGWPGRLSETDKTTIRFVHDIAQTARERRPLHQVAADILNQIAKEIHAARAAVFSMDFRTNRVEMLCSKAVSMDNIRSWSYKLPKSPINDVIYEQEHIFEKDADKNEGKFRNLRRAVEFRSCIAIPVPGATDEIGYGLFLFHSNSHHFSQNHLIRAEATAAILGLAIREQWLIQKVASDQRLTLLGSTITSIGHELRNRLGALEAVGPLEKAWQELKNNPSLLENQEFLSRRIELNLRRLADARRGAGSLADILLGAVRERQEQALDANASIQQAIRMLEHRAVKSKILLVFEPNWLPIASGNTLELQQVFINLLINSIEQMPNARRERGRVTIRTGYYGNDRDFPIKIRFSDTGPGIHMKNLHKIFEPMFSTKIRGTGMGLYICRDLLGLMGGKIRVEQTAILVGTTFLVELPITRESSRI